MTPRTYPQAAAELGCAEEFLRRNIKKLPHHKVGKTVSFHDDDMELLRQRFAVRPEPVVEPVVDPWAPLTRRRRRAS